MANKAQATAKDAPRSFEQAIAEVEKIVARLEGGKLDLAESLEEYQRGVGTLKECYELLNNAERKITLLSGFDAEGNPVTEPFEEQPMTMEEKQSARSKRRSAAPRSGGIAHAAGSDYFDDEDSRDGLF